MLKLARKRIKDLLIDYLPLPVRRVVCLLINYPSWLNADLKYWWTRELLRDFRERDPNGYHQFLWSNHLAYALTYEEDARFGYVKMVKSRQIFFSDLKEQLHDMDVDPATDIRSVLEVGCSLGYQLRYMETNLFPAAEDLDGIDIDHYAIKKGTQYLEGQGSKVKLSSNDMVDLDRILDGKKYDLVISTGVLMYLDEPKASAVVQAMLRHSKRLVAVSGPAHGDFDNQGLERSVPRGNDGAFIHNLDRMIRQSGGTIVGRRWEGGRFIDGQTLYFVFATTEPSRLSKVGVKTMNGCEGELQ